jgi:septum formation protein
MESIILASGSLRRQEYFRLLGLPFKIVSPRVDEANVDSLPVAEYAIETAKKKLQKVLTDVGGKKPLWAFAADTVIELGGHVFGKPPSREEAENYLRSLSGKEHSVITACALYNNRSGSVATISVSTKIYFATLTDDDIGWYLETGEWQGSAGAYKIQGLGGCFVQRLEGSYSNVVGLPLREFYQMLIENGYPYRDKTWL